MAAGNAEPPVHGGDLDAARRRFPQAPEPCIDLSTGINPHPWPIPVLSAEAWARLPLASEERALRAAAARRYGVGDFETVVAAPGTQALIEIIPRLRPRSSVAVIGPTYEEHARAWASDGHDVREVAVLAAAADADVVVLVNPDNPTGRVVPRRDLAELSVALDRRGGMLVIDEAFADAMDAEHSLAPISCGATIVLRSFGKIYGLAGLRLGFAVAPRPHAQRLRGWLGPWAVSGPALEIGRLALQDSAWLAATRLRLTADVRRLDALLSAAGCTVLGGTPLFRLIGHPDAGQLADVLGLHGIHVRRFPARPAWLRFGLPGPEPAWQRLAAALAAGAQCASVSPPTRR